jgi:hypothetical protein
MESFTDAIAIGTYYTQHNFSEVWSTWYDMICRIHTCIYHINMYVYIIHIYLTAVGLTPGGSSTSHIYTQTVHIIQRKENLEVRAVPRLCQLHPGICLTTEEKARENLSYGSTILEQWTVTITMNTEQQFCPKINLNLVSWLLRLQSHSTVYNNIWKLHDGQCQYYGLIGHHHHCHQHHHYWSYSR